MQLSQEALQEFKQLWKADHPGQDLGDQELLELATRTITVVGLIYNG